MSIGSLKVSPKITKVGKFYHSADFRNKECTISEGPQSCTEIVKTTTPRKLYYFVKYSSNFYGTLRYLIIFLMIT
ncbi:uncharacterized protein DC041_0011856 [Schistosoma bovis]|uniref:Uncharacterized protein n=1 Tax=Schistosoma bovis TaxID=6184 RepID=A0A430QQI4_SCHBO|nr:uncharacterized protein DC041_0011856 [Schistosoma bovis]